ncbi:leucyl aminopeptidase family protein [Gallaecimonas kandeliae]|uniref:M17 family metallopeptidase n=1 Tax=Gallaecimonas kandeliae TaxID=3029055 RepID=UPI002649606F|nr:leucyl aminopeptidase family protein [Gallaecimonas kandeliae]WKE65596.1 leucyl aminopeptidase family protein [Gallaecimonas kandeliae]
MQDFQFPDVQIASGRQDSALLILVGEAGAPDALASLKALAPKAGAWLLAGAQPTLVVAPKAVKSPFERHNQVRKWLAVLGDAQFESVQLKGDDKDWLEALAATLLARQLRLPSFKKDKGEHQALRRISVEGPELDAGRLLAEARGNALARWLSALPASELTPAKYRTVLEALARDHGWQLEIFDQTRLAGLGAGAFLAVAQGSDNDEAAIVRLRHRPKAPSGKLALVGKGLCFDTGGYNLKTSHMFGMHGDMGGSAVALGTLLALTELGSDLEVDCWLALAENHIGPKAYKPNDLVVAMNGTSIEVVDTDAEGRMVLADTLTLASREKPDLVMDYATLTGACIRAIGTAQSGVFSNRDDWREALIQAGRASGERVWPFPLDEDYDDNIESDVADVKQCHPGTSCDHIDAARFLSRFVEEGVNWVHVDLSAAEHKGGLGLVDTEVTGFGVRFTLAALPALMK